MTMTATEILLALASGGLIGVVLGLVGGGGSILAVPLLVYVVGVGSTHAAIGTAAVAVAANAAASLGGHARAGMVKWPCALSLPQQVSSARRSGRRSAKQSAEQGC
jgi:uncharacterized membrane protein YfcA